LSTRLFLILTLALFSVSSTSIVIRYVAGVPALTLAFWRMLSASGMLWSYSRFTVLKPLSRANKIRIVFAGISLGLHFSFFFIGVRNTTIANATLFATTGPFFTTIFSLLLGQKIHRKIFIGLAFAIIGFIIIQGSDFNIGAKFLYGNLISLLSGFCIAVTYIFASKIREDTENVVYGRTLFFIASITIGLMAFAFGDSLFFFKKGDIIWLLFLGFVPSILGHNMLNYSIKYLSPTAVASVPLGEPIIASLFGYILFSEKLPLESLIGGPFILFGIFFIITGHNKG
jgi:drug/metabolite transporter (DMT)-like permease